MSSALLQISRLCHRHGSVPTLQEVTFEVQAGEVLGVLGPNGAGKTTLLSVLAGLLRPQSGGARLGGEDLLSGCCKARVGLVPQEVALYPTLTLRDNLLFFGGLYGLRGGSLAERAHEALELVGLSGRGGQRLDTCSGGMKRRLNLAAALLHRPQLLLLDEPTVGVDPQSRDHLLQSVGGLARQEGTAVIYATHYMEEAERLCHRVAVLDRGRLLACDTPARLMDSEGGGGGAVVITLDEHRLDGLAEAAARLPGAGRVRWAEEGGREAESAGSGPGVLAVESAAPGELLPRLLELCSRMDAGVRGVDLMRPSLQAVFLHLTGRKLRDP